MNLKVYCFSGTGNTLYVAEKIAEKLGCEVEGIQGFIEKDMVNPNAEKIVIAFPVYAWGPPSAVMKFLGKFKGIDSSDIYCVMTYGGSAGATATIFRKKLESCGGKLSAALGLRMPDNCITLFNSPAEEKIAEILKNSHDRIKEIAEYIDSGKKGDIETSGFPVNLLSVIVYNLFISRLPKFDENFYSNEKCTKCGICKKICPVENIDLADGKPVWNGKCEQCMACIQWCPVEAIQYKKKTIKRKRYHHPDIKINDMIAREK